MAINFYTMPTQQGKVEYFFPSWQHSFFSFLKVSSPFTFDAEEGNIHST
jgi:hypothetical protein